MKSIHPLLFTVIFLFSGFHSFSQFSNIVIFTQANEPFIVVMNGIQQSPNPETNVKVTGLNAPNYKVKVLFENKTIPEIDKTIYLQPEVEVAYEALKNSKGTWVLRMLSSTPIDEIPEPQSGQDIYIYSATPRLSTTTISQTTTVNTGGLMGGASITTTTTQTSSNGTSQQVDYDEERMEHPEYTGPRGCPRPMSPHSFDQAL